MHTGRRQWAAAGPIKKRAEKNISANPAAASSDSRRSRSERLNVLTTFLEDKPCGYSTLLYLSLCTELVEMVKHVETS